MQIEQTTAADVSAVSLVDLHHLLLAEVDARVGVNV
jgi:hypothetical protein